MHGVRIKSKPNSAIAGEGPGRTGRGWFEPAKHFAPDPGTGHPGAFGHGFEGGMVTGTTAGNRFRKAAGTLCSGCFPTTSISPVPSFRIENGSTLFLLRGFSLNGQPDRSGAISCRRSDGGFSVVSPDLFRFARGDELAERPTHHCRHYPGPRSGYSVDNQRSFPAGQVPDRVRVRSRRFRRKNSREHFQRMAHPAGQVEHGQFGQGHLASSNRRSIRIHRSRGRVASCR